LEDNLRDAELIQAALDGGGIEATIVHVKNRREFEAAIERDRFDLILSDYSLPQYNAMAALEFVRSKTAGVPFILLSGTVGEDVAVESLKTGATDYILKERLNRLVPAVQRALREAEDQVERKRLEEHLRQGQKMEAIGQLAGGIAHDFNNILGCIVGYTELAAMEPTVNKATHENLQEVLKASQRAKELVRQILTFSRQQEQERTATKLQLVIEEALKLLRASLPATIEICTEMEPEIPGVFADPTQIHQIIMNLATNAAHAMGRGSGRLGIKLSAIEVDATLARKVPDLTIGRYARVSVSDTGCGMDSATLQRIFEPFFTTKPPGEGTGLGLSVVHGIMKVHEGAITVHSELGKGSTFELFFPALKGEAKQPASEPSSIPRGNGERILFIDDEPMLANVSKKVLERAGYAVFTQTSSVEALATFRRAPDQFDLVITDLTMPNLNGEDLAREFLKLRADLPIILMTGEGSSMTPGKADELGFRALIMKPATAQSLAGAVRSVFEPSKGN
jgi:signal transduction histidine kinase